MMVKTEIIIIGAGHAGCEAALAAARMGKDTVVFVMDKNQVANMPCNPNIGGTSKGHLVKEIDALGGQMGKNIDKTYIQSRMLNTGKGPAVHSLRAQADKYKYAAAMLATLQTQPKLKLVQDEVVDIAVENGCVTGVVTKSGDTYTAKAVVVCGGTYFRSRCIHGDISRDTGPNGAASSMALSAALKKKGIAMFRFKTGTPARIARDSIDFTKLEEQPGDLDPTPFSFTNTNGGWEPKEQISCYLTYTTEQTHKIILANIHRSPMYSGEIEGTPTRYCPSIEDKVVRFADKDRHQVFIEPEGTDTNEMYIGGMSTSLPEDVQKEMYSSVPGLENCRILQYGYAIEYDAIDATTLHLSLEHKGIGGLFFAGQMNGSSGYEEAAAQGIMAGINAVLSLDSKEPFIIDRSQGYIGVLIDDLVTKGTKEPYRMMTSRAEYRLILRQDNADLRLTELGYDLGLITNERYRAFLAKKSQIEGELDRVAKITIPPSEEFNEYLQKQGQHTIATGTKLTDLIKRPQLNYDMLAPFDPTRPSLPKEVGQQINIQIKYEGYISRQMRQVEQFKKMENRTLPEIDYMAIQGMRLEARQKLNQIRPYSLGHASRISGVSPADISTLVVWLQTQTKDPVR
ncbi:MAG: tRNA uridine-5-carboxymethylaminomethyl(34) synthesis enzyme MnmG [Defluviitaleaceae bacterium]|nr:tRNA uridine-5-carboxymethylaminomethyl(34) synthesis enzyme MnmG [Defluviitaleaceae bacterium]